MLEVFFILTVIYVAYVIYTITGDDVNIADKPPIAKTKTVSAIIATPKVAIPTPSGKPKKAPPVKPAAVPVKASKPVKAKTKKTAAPKIELRTVIMKNLKTGEEAKVASNYRMVKRWVKEALVEEGLLEKIYKNTELDDANKAKAAEALSIIKAMDKYKP